MKLSEHPVVKGCFLLRENRFIARVRLENGEEERVHVPNTGRMKELLTPEAAVLLSYDPAPHRKTAYTLIAAEYQGIWVSVHAVKANALAAEWLAVQPGISDVKREVTYGSSRFDLGCRKDGKQAYFEVKSVNLVVDGAARFPDAPTTRGVKHLKELQKAQSEGFSAGIIFVIQRQDAAFFEPNRATDPAFSDQLKICADQGMEIRALRCVLTENSISIEKEIPISV